MTVRIQHKTEERFIKVPMWHYKLFWQDPEDYLAPFFENRTDEVEWEVIG